MTETFAFERAHEIIIDAPAAAIFDYVTNPQTWPQWIAASHQIDSADKPLTTEDTFSETWATRKGEVTLNWVITTCERPTCWVGETGAAFLGPIIVRYDLEAVGDGQRFTRTVSNPARPKPPTPEMIAAVDAEAATALANIKRNVEAQT